MMSPSMCRERSGAISWYAGESHHARASAIPGKPITTTHPGPAALLHLVLRGVNEEAAAVQLEGGGDALDVFSDLRVRGGLPQVSYGVPPSLDGWLPREHLARFVADLFSEVLDPGSASYPLLRDTFLAAQASVQLPLPSPFAA
jgi:hypothetical protein